MGLFDKLKKKKLETGLEKTRTGFFQSIVNTLTNSQINNNLSSNPVFTFMYGNYQAA